MTVEIPLRKTERITLIDERDGHLANYEWSWHSSFGVIRYDAEEYNPKAQRTPHVIMARQITQAPTRWYVIHLDGDRLNNKRSNLLLLNAAQNAQYIRKARGKSRYKGVAPKGGTFEVMIQGEYIGKFKNEEDAALAYDEEAIVRYGTSARLNFPREFQVCHECHKAHFSLATLTACAECKSSADPKSNQMNS